MSVNAQHHVPRHRAPSRRVAADQPHRPAGSRPDLRRAQRLRWLAVLAVGLVTGAAVVAVRLAA